MQQAEQAGRQLTLDETDSRQQLTAAERQLEQLRQQSQQLHRRLDAKTNELNLTKSLVDSLEGFPESIKYLQTNAREWRTEAVPLLVNLINCPDEYKPAVENYLKHYLHYYVVETVAEAQRALHLLHRKQKGKAGFFVLDQLNSSITSATELYEEGKVAALAVVSVSELRYEPLLNHLLHDVYVVEDDYFLLQETDSPQLFNYITKDGRLMQNGYQLEGGWVGAYEGKRIGKRQQVEQLQHEITVLNKEVADLDKQVAQQQQQVQQVSQAVRSQEQRSRQQREQVNRLEQQRLQVKWQLENGQRFIAESQTRSEQLRQRAEQLAREIEAAQIELAEKQQIRNQLQQTLQQVEAQHRQIGNELSEAGQTLNDRNLGYVQQQNKAASIEQNLRFKQQQFQQTQAQHSRNQTGRRNSQPIAPKRRTVASRGNGIGQLVRAKTNPPN